MTGAAVIDVRGLTKRFGTAGPPVIDNLSFVIPRGGRVALFAPTGSGKATISRTPPRSQPAATEKSRTMMMKTS